MYWNFQSFWNQKSCVQTRNFTLRNLRQENSKPVKEFPKCANPVVKFWRSHKKNSFDQQNLMEFDDSKEILFCGPCKRHSKSKKKCGYHLGYFLSQKFVANSKPNFMQLQFFCSPNQLNPSSWTRHLENQLHIDALKVEKAQRNQGQMDAIWKKQENFNSN